MSRISLVFFNYHMRMTDKYAHDIFIVNSKGNALTINIKKGNGKEYGKRKNYFFEWCNQRRKNIYC